MPTDIQQGTKLDSEKIKLQLVDPYWVEEVAKVLTFGASKYNEENWRKGFAFKRLIGALKRHVAEIEKGVDIDPETGYLHASHASCCLMFLTYHIMFLPQFDDRYRRPSVQVDASPQPLPESGK